MGNKENKYEYVKDFLINIYGFVVILFLWVLEFPNIFGEMSLQFLMVSYKQFLIIRNMCNF